MKKKTKVQLVLGSGGARGLAHIGVIEMLLENGYEIVEVIGCSMGAVVGGMYCSGNLPLYKDWLLKQSKTDVYRLFDITFSLQGLVKGERIFNVLKQMAGEQLLENLPIPFCAVAMNILTQKEVHFRFGSLYRALRASTGIPGVFTPFEDGNALFVDGGVLNPLPVNLIKRRKDAMLVAVNLNGAFENEVAPHAIPDMKAEVEAQNFLSKLRNYLPGHVHAEEVKATVEHAPNLSMFDIMSASYDASLDRIVQLTLAANPVDALIQIPRNTCSVFEFYRAAELISIGKEAYKKYIPE